MGIRFKSNTWRAPLRLIDNLLPERRPDANPNAVGRKPSRLMDAFARAGWLKGSFAAPKAVPASVPPTRLQPSTPCSVRVLRSGAAGVGRRQDMRLVISGRIGDVCAELDRLAALEQAAFARRL